MKYALPILFAATALNVQAKDIKYRDCPLVIRKAITANLDGGKLDDIERVKVNGKTQFVVDIDGPGNREFTLRFNAAGVVLLKSEDIGLRSCPTAVRNRISSLLAVKGRSIDDIDRLTKGSTVTYRVELDRKTAKSDLVYTISGSGKILSRTVER